MVVYLICSQTNDLNLYKIGFTKRDIKKRIADLQTGNANEIYLIDYFESKWSTKIERYLHKLFKEKRLKGEWFSLSDNDLEIFKEKCQMIHNNFEILENENTLVELIGRKMIGQSTQSLRI